MCLPAELRERRREKRVSQGEVGVELGRSQFWVSLVERGQIASDEATAERMILAIDRIVERRKAINEATARAVTEFENRKISVDVGL
jgi:predicted transcriptional regulator